MRLRNPEFLFLLIAWIPMVWVYIRRERTSNPAVRFSDLSLIRKLPRSPLLRARHALITLRAIGFGLLVVALARPQKGTTDEEITTEGVDIMLILDISQSMSALDFQPDNRLTVAKQTISEFIAKREHDRIGLVVFAARSFTKCPLTLDYGVLTQFVDEITFTDFSHQTAIGTALATAANRLTESMAKSKVAILLTDGASNAGDIPPQTAANAARELGIKIYTIGVGKDGQVPIPVEGIDPFTGKKIRQIQMMQSDLDEQSLVDIAHATGGEFFRARSEDELRKIYEQIDKLEKTEIKTHTYTSYAERFFRWLVAGTVLLILELVLQYTIFRRIP